MSDTNKEESSSGEETDDEIPQIPPLNLNGPNMVKIDQSQDVKIGNTININYNVVMKNQNSNQLMQLAGPSGTDWQRTMGELIQDAVAKALPLYLPQQQQHGQNFPAIEINQRYNSICDNNQQLPSQNTERPVTSPEITDPDDSSTKRTVTVESHQHNRSIGCVIQEKLPEDNDQSILETLENRTGRRQQICHTSAYEEMPLREILPVVRNEFVHNTSKTECTSENCTKNLKKSPPRTTTLAKNKLDKICIYQPLRYLDFTESEGEKGAENNFPKSKNDEDKTKNSPVVNNTGKSSSDISNEKICIYEPLRIVDFIEEEEEEEEEINQSKKNYNSTVRNISTSNSTSTLKLDKFKKKFSSNMKLLAEVILQEMFFCTNSNEIFSFELSISTSITADDFQKTRYELELKNGTFINTNNVNLVSVKNLNIIDDYRLEFIIQLTLDKSNITFENFYLSQMFPIVRLDFDLCGTISMEIPVVSVILTVNFLQYSNEINDQINVEFVEINCEPNDLKILYEDGYSNNRGVQKNILKNFLLEEFYTYLKKDLTRELREVAGNFSETNKETIISDIIKDLFISYHSL